MDEPFASVDAQTREDLEDLVLSVKKKFNMTILFVTHDIDESVYLANRVVVLSKPPTFVVTTLDIPLPDSRDQIETKEDPEFIRLRGEVARLIRHPGNDDATVPVAELA
jgi:NitT/TauT family transport system ATP-binding protein